MLALLILMTVAVSAEAGTVRGVVRNLETAEPLPFTSVQLLGETLRTGTAADDAGAFSFTRLDPGAYELRFFFIGFESRSDTVRVGAADTVTVEISLRPEGFQVETVEVVAERVEEIEEDVRAGFVRLDIEELESIPAVGESDPIRSLQLLPGVQAASDISSGLYVRGGGPDQTLILLDRVTIYNPTHAFGLFSAFNSDAVEEVSLFKGAYPAEYVGRLGSVLDVRSRTGERTALGGRGAVSTITGRFLLEGPVGRGSWLLSGRRTYLEPILSVLRRSNDDIPSYYFYDFNGSFTQNLENGDILRVSGYQGRDRILFDLAGDTRIELGWGNRTLAANYTRFLDRNAFLNLQASGSEYESLTDVEIFSTPITVENRLRDLGFRADLTVDAGAGHRLRGGVQATRYRFTYRQDFNDDSSIDFTNQPTDLSVYAEDEWTSEQGTVLRPGLRARYFSEGDRLLVEPRFSGAVPLERRWKLTFGGGLYHQVLQLVATEGFAAGDFFFPVDQTAEPGRSWQAVAGVTWDPSPDYELTGEVYYTGLSNLLLFDNDAPAEPEVTTDGIFLTGGKGYATGVELFAQKRTGALRGWVGYTLGWTRRTFEELNGGLEFPPKYDRRHDINAVATLTRGPWTFGGSFVLGSGQAFTPASARFGFDNPATGTTEEGGFVLPAARNSARLLPYHRLDVSVARDFSLFDLEAEWIFQVFNLYSRRNEWFVQFDPADPENEPQIVRQLPIIPSLGVRFAF